MKGKMLAYLLVLALLVTMVSGCGGTGTTAKTQPDKPVKDLIVLAINADMGSLDPLHTSTIVDNMIFKNIYDSLVNNDKSGGFVPSLAENWTVADDGVSYTFKLKKGVKFQNGEEFKASDVVFTVNAAMKSPYLASIMDPIKDAAALDDYTVKFNLKYAYSPFLLVLTRIYMLNEKAVTGAGNNYGQNPVGTGAYKFVKHDSGQRVVLERYDGYFNGPAPIKNVEFKVITDSNTTQIALESGEIDFAFGVPAISIQGIKANKALATHEFDAIHLTFVILNNTVKPFDNKLVRQAINYAIDKDALIQIVLEGMGKNAQSILNKLTFGYSENIKGYEYNPEKAKELLAQAGYPNGFKISFKTMDGPLKKGAEVIQENLSKIGVTTSIEMCEQNAFNKDMMSGNYEMGNMGITLIQDADSWDLVLKTKGGYNWERYSNPKVDELFSQGKKLTDKNERLAKYEKLVQIVNDDAPLVPLFHKMGIYFSRKDLKVGYIDASGYLKVAEMSWEK
ncbi:ABC transporter substrate-binding protein [Desulfosporosinus sp. BICA1-9]|uniref:ABC transporter substrate-binding protein n=1 Tax=Desulfosporosinus sp. BICA1-9 TaxID=1531958 RepID=UPI00054B626E|nr:ABC transporter substrate-binding protein [Desulfosporosinus sp. BICA1-9]KJS46769.1 MAG: hypothetical protein VR66_23560 [Peptococcaceae bacterium BRH_c23]KJS83860.1 MAG: hypothetical protein JL57_21820 [Desulfosporosinus sp. BICA1-9]HBW38700.1 ABC transporter substrate-binding protein [Desulfosporosinus sp.]